MKRLGLIGSTVLAACLAVNAQAIPLSDLLNGSELRVEDKLFSDWELILQADPTTGPAIDLSGIEVTVLESEDGADNPGLRFEAGETLSIFGGDPDGDELLLWFSYVVTVADGVGKSIVGADMALTGYDVSSAAEGLVWIEKFIDPAGSSIEVYEDQIDQEGFGNLQLSDSTGFGGQKSILVEDLIFLSGAEGDTVVLSSWEQRFRQREDASLPGTLALIGLGLLGLARRRAA